MKKRSRFQMIEKQLVARISPRFSTGDRPGRSLADNFLASIARCAGLKIIVFAQTSRANGRQQLFLSKHHGRLAENNCFCLNITGDRTPTIVFAPTSRAIEAKQLSAPKPPRAIACQQLWATKPPGRLARIKG
jgi:hypothetical protein